MRAGYGPIEVVHGVSLEVRTGSVMALLGPNGGVIDRGDNHGGNDDPTFIADYAAWMKANNVAWASYFNFNDGGLNSTLSAFPNSLAAYKADLG